MRQPRISRSETQERIFELTEELMEEHDIPQQKLLFIVYWMLETDC